MNTIKLATVVIALLGNVGLFAQESTKEFTESPPSTRTRADVKAELVQAQGMGLLDTRGETYGSFDTRKFESTRSRTDVLAELDAARRTGELDRHNHTYGSFARSEISSTRSRAEVKAELAQALAAGSRLSQGESRGG